jgi:hypothetical protein
VLDTATEDENSDPASERRSLTIYIVIARKYYLISQLRKAGLSGPKAGLAIPLGELQS